MALNDAPPPGMTPPPGIAPPPDVAPWRRDAAIAAALMLAFFLLAMARLGEPAVAVFDEIFHARAGFELAAGRAPSERTHPPLVKDAIALAVNATGAGFDPATASWEAGKQGPYPPGAPWAWRLPSVVAGTAAVGLMFALARALIGSTAVATAAAALLALDGCFFVHARVAQTNVYEVAFLLAAALGAWQTTRTRDDRWLALAGGAIGLAVACRWSSLAGWALLGGWLAWALRHDPRGLLRLAAAWTVLPAVVYAGSYVPLVAASGSLTDPGSWRRIFVDAQPEMYRYHALLAEAHPYQSPWWSWPLMARPVWYAFWIKAPVVQGVWAIGNAAIWWASVPALVGAAWAGWKGDRALGLLAVLGLGSWLAWAVQPRALTFMHYYLATIPFACVALAAYGMRWWHGGGPFDRPAARLVVAAFGLAVVAWFVAYYPLLSGLPTTEDVLMRRVWFGAAWL
jgi:dolichyl-phosphate-mannose--protein O-mannosyl transferase